MDSHILSAAIAGNLAICLSTIAAKLANNGKIEKPKKRKLWIKPCRESKSDSIQSVQELFRIYKLYNKIDKTYTLLDESLFKDILKVIESNIKRVDTLMRKSIQVEEKLAAILRYLSAGENHTEISKFNNVSDSYLNSASPNVCNAIYNNFKPKYLRCPDEEMQWQKIASEYENTYNFPMCVGAVDFIHIPFKGTNSERASNKFFNSKGTQSVYLFAMTNAAGQFIAIDIGQSGGDSYQEAFQNSDLMQVLKDIEKLKYKRKFPYVVLAENDFASSANLMLPYTMKLQTIDEKQFNNRHRNAFYTINDAFATMQHNFKILEKLSIIGRKKAVAVAQCCCVLHNYLIEKKCPWYIRISADRSDKNSATILNETLNNKACINSRILFKEYFSKKTT